jgi:hypothetical protein
MHRARCGLILACLAALAFGAMTVSGAQAVSPGPAPAQMQPLVQPVLVWRDCQRIARCHGCRPVYHCRSCSYQRTCKRNFCGWADVCVWGPYLPLAPRGVPIY